MKRILFFCICILVICLVGCENPEAKNGSATVYGATDACPVCVTVKVDGDGKVGEVEINEYLSVYDIGKLQEKDGKFYKYGVEIAETDRGYARYVKVGVMMFVCEDGVYACEAITGEDKSFDTYIKSNGRWYISQVSNGNFDITDEQGEPYNIAFNEYDGYRLSKKLWANKMKNGYHEGVEYDSGWKENIYKLITHIKNHGFYEYSGEEKPSGDQKTYKIGKYDTLVDLENFHDYMRLSQKAYEQARNNVN